MGGVGDTYGCAAELTRPGSTPGTSTSSTTRSRSSTLLRGRGLKVGLLSNSARDLGRFVAHHDLTVDAVLTSRDHGKTKPHEAIFLRMLELLDVAPPRRVMVGDKSRTTSRAREPSGCARC